MMENRRCPRDGCEFNSMGTCLEGFLPASTCPYVASEIGSDDFAVSSEPEPIIALPSGEALNESQAEEVIRQGLTRVVIVAGPSGSGKTTILTSLFDAFLEAPFGNFLFAGSRTLVGFERRCHDAREASGRDVAHTVHTSVDASDFLHLRLLPASATALGIQNLLLSDISGERFKKLRDSSDAVKEMPMLKRADHLCLVLDCEKLVDPAKRHSARSDVRTLLRSIVEAGALSSSCRIDIVFAKWDLVLSSPDVDTTKAFMAETKSALTSLIGSVLPMNCFEVAARPSTRKIPFAFGLPTLLRHWLAEPLPSRPKIYLPRETEGMRESARFAASVFRDQPGDHYDVHWV
jgi:hypothetical protein